MSGMGGYMNEAGPRTGVGPCTGVIGAPRRGAAREPRTGVGIRTPHRGHWNPAQGCCKNPAQGCDQDPAQGSFEPRTGVL